jgi:hypothetical protein
MYKQSKSVSPETCAHISRFCKSTLSEIPVIKLILERVPISSPTVQVTGAGKYNNKKWTDSQQRTCNNKKEEIAYIFWGGSNSVVPVIDPRYF